MTGVTEGEQIAPLSNAELYIELATLTLLIMRWPAGPGGAAGLDAARRLVANFEIRASEILQRAAPAAREYAAQRIAELVQASPVYRSLADNNGNRRPGGPVGDAGCDEGGAEEALGAAPATDAANAG